MEIATQLMDGVLALHSLWAKDMYVNTYNLIRPCISRGPSKKEEMAVLQKIFGKFGGIDVKLKALKEDFLRKHPSYVQGTKRKRDAKEAAAKVLLTGLLDNMPTGYNADKALQEKIQRRFVAFITAMKEDVSNAGMGELNDDQVDSIVVGTWMHHLA